MAKSKQKLTGKTRANGTGSVYIDRATGNHYAQITWTSNVAGKPKRHVRRMRAISNTKREAWELMPALREEVDAERARTEARAIAVLDGTAGKVRDVNPKTFTFGELAAYHCEDNLTPARFDEVTGVKLSGLLSWQDARRKVAALVHYFDAKKLVASLTVGQIRKFKNDRLNQAPIVRVKVAGTDRIESRKLKHADGAARTLTIATVHRELAALRRMINYAVAEQWLDRNPMTGHKDLVNPDAEHTRETIVDTVAEAALIDHCFTDSKRKHLAPYLEVMFGSGCRSIELRRMLVRDVNFEAEVDGEILGTFHVYSFKGRRRKDRDHVMTPRARAALLTAVAGKGPDDHVFTYDVPRKHPDGTDYIEHRPMKNAPKRSFATAKREATEWSKGKFDLSGFRGHDIRHTVVTRLVESGETCESAGKSVGHEQPTTTWRYNNPDHSSGARIASKLANYGKTQVLTFKRKRKVA